ncbi:hypothetical protein PAL_GLEAN10011054 [Pteropus alecto]|uniref:Uncharacterized protein n=1 Tax=Pteropus alecto TaxID=9402 RepID=L5KVD3_PTEAL|nr:hypothetical protein PAL_GLEAN10011054 [Pteropus alecto]
MAPEARTPASFALGGETSEFAHNPWCSASPRGGRGQTDETTTLKGVLPGAQVAQTRTQTPSGKSPRTALRGFVAETLAQKGVEWLLMTPAALRQSILLSLTPEHLQSADATSRYLGRTQCACVAGSA